MKKHFMQVLSIRSAMLSVAFLLMSLLSFSASAYDFEIDGIGYNIKSATEHTVEVAVLSNEPSRRDCVIPESVTWQDTQYSVVAISLNTYFLCKTVSIPASVLFIKSFNSESLTAIFVDEHNPTYCSIDGVLFNKDITQILIYPDGKPNMTYSIPSTVTAIGDNAFSGARNLQEIILPHTVESIGTSSFSCCTSLISIDFPDSVKSIGIYAMSGCSSLRTVSMGKSLNEIGFAIFSGCNSLTEINVDKDNSNYCSIDGALYNADATKLLTFPASKDVDLYSFPNTIQTIGMYAFKDCKALHLTLPNSVKNISTGAFYTSSLKSISIPASVSYISSAAFDSCFYLSEIIVSEENVVYSSLNGILYNKAQTSLLCCPADYPTSKFEITDNVSCIGSHSFIKCKKIEKINIPESVTEIGNGAFSGCISLKSIIIPNSVEVINGLILLSCENLQDVTIGAYVKEIKDGAFSLSKKISTFRCLTTVPPIVSGSNHFEPEVYQSATLYVPNGCKEAYSSAAMWSNFQNIVEMEPVGISDINAADGEVSVTVENGAIVVNGADGTVAVEVYTADGRCVYRGNNTEITGIAHGLYIVRVGSTVSKVVL